MQRNTDSSAPFEDALDACIDALIRGDSIERCLARHPERARELEPLLLAAQEMITAPRPLPVPELKAETLKAILQPQLRPEESRLRDALAHSIDLMVEGKSVQHCLEQHPELANSLRPLLTAASTVGEGISIQADPEFKASAKRRVMERFPQGGGLLGWVSRVLTPRWAYGTAIAAAVLLVTVSAGYSTLRASDDSAPDDLLYPVKTFSENVRMSLTGSVEGEARLHVELADRRAQEIVQAAASGDQAAIDDLLAQMETHLQEASRLTEEKQISEAVELVLGSEGHADGNMDRGHVRDLLEILGEDIRVNDARLRLAMDDATPEMNHRIGDAMARVRSQYMATIADLEVKHSSEALDHLNGMRVAFNR